MAAGVAACESGVRRESSAAAEAAAALWADYRRERSEANRNALLGHYLPMLQHECNSFCPQRGGINWETLYDAGLDALLYCVEHFRSGRFRSYAKSIMRKRMMGAAVAARRRRSKQRGLDAEMVEHFCVKVFTRHRELGFDCDETVKREFGVLHVTAYYLIFHASYTQSEVAALLGLEIPVVGEAIRQIRARIRATGSHGDN